MVCQNNSFEDNRNFRALEEVDDILLAFAPKGKLGTCVHQEFVRTQVREHALVLRGAMEALDLSGLDAAETARHSKLLALL